MSNSPDSSANVRQLIEEIQSYLEWLRAQPPQCLEQNSTRNRLLTQSLILIRDNLILIWLLIMTQQSLGTRNESDQPRPTHPPRTSTPDPDRPD